MSSRHKKSTDLAVLYSQFVERQPAEWQSRFQGVTRHRARMVARLLKHGVVKVSDLLRRLSQLPDTSRLFGINTISLFRIRQGIPVLLELLLDRHRGLRIACADALSRLKPRRNVTRVFVEIGNRELKSSNPDRHWIETVIYGVGSPDDAEAVELLITIFDREDLPGWVRGDAADKLGWAAWG